MTNPPFGSNLVVPESVAREEGLLSCRKWIENEGDWEPSDKIVQQQLGIAFFERDLNLLKDGGHLAIVLPETFLFSKSFRWFVDWICKTCTITHIIDVPMVAFEEFCRAKTCLVFVRKLKPSRGHKITLSYPRSIGQDKRGAPLYRLDESGARSGELDNEMADAVKEIVGLEYRGTARATSSSSSTRFCFQLTQEEAQKRGVLVPRFWWRKDAQKALRSWARTHSAGPRSLGELVDKGVISVFEGHGSPPGNARATGDVPYVKVTDLKNWRINENPTNFVHQDVANALKRRGIALRFGDLISPARASSNIGQFSLVLPWQTNILLTKEVMVLRVNKNEDHVTAFLMIALMSLKVVQDQYKNLVLMQTNREHLGDHWREVVIPFPVSKDECDKIGQSAKNYFDGIIKAQDSWNALTKAFNPSAFGTRP